jgi:hypothetical protein
MDSFSWGHAVSAFNLQLYALFVMVVAVLVKPLSGFPTGSICTLRVSRKPGRPPFPLPN